MPAPPPTDSTLVFALDPQRGTALAARLAAAARCVVLVQPHAAESGGPTGPRWVLPWPARREALEPLVVRIWDELGGVRNAVVEVGLDIAADGSAAWEVAAGERLEIALAIARTLGLRMTAAQGGQLVLLAAAASGAASSAAADVIAAGVRAMTHGLAKAFGPAVRVCAALGGPPEEARASGEPAHAPVPPHAIAAAVAGLLANRALASGSVVHVDPRAAPEP